MSTKENECKGRVDRHIAGQTASEQTAAMQLRARLSTRFFLSWDMLPPL